MADSIYTFDPTPGNNTALDSIPYGPNQLYHNQIDNWFRALASKLAQHVDDLGGVNTVAGTANAITVTLASGITAYATGQLFWFKNTGGPNTTAATMNVNSIGIKEIRLQGDTALSGGEMVDNGYYGLLYDAAYDGGDGGFVLLNPEKSTTFATNAQAMQATSTTLSVNPANLSNIYSLLLGNAIEIADLKGSRLNMAGGIADAYDSETDVDTATSTNESYDSVNDMYSPTVSAGSLISAATGTNIGTMSGGGGLAAAYDSTTSQSFSASAASPSDTTNSAVGKNYTGAAKKIGSGRIYSSNDRGFLRDNAAYTITMRAKVGGSDPSNWVTEGVSLGSQAGTDSGATPEDWTIASSDQATDYDRAWFVITTSGSNAAYVAEAQFYAPGTVNNMTLVSNAFTASAVPTQARVAVFIDPQVSITINTDFTAEASRDGGTTWTAVTLALVSNPVGTVEQYEGTASISSQPSGTSMKYRLKTLNNKDIDVTGIVFQWS